MSVSVEVRRSAIHGKGVFAGQGIRKGTKVGLYGGRATMDDGTYVLWVEQDDGSWRGIDGDSDLKYLNHSAQPNCEFDGDQLLALQPIRAGDELTFHYGEEWDDA